MFKRLKQSVYLILFSFFITNLSAEDNFCINKDGFIYPIFEAKICEDTTEELLSKKEFSYLIDFENNLRISKLEEYRENKDKIDKEQKQKIVESINSEKDKSSFEKKKKELEQKKIAKLAKEQKQADERRLKKEQRIKEIEKKRLEIEQKRLIRKKEQEKKRQEIQKKRLAKKLETQQKKEEKNKQKLLKKIELEKKKKLRKEKQEEKRLAKKKIKQESEDQENNKNITLNNNLKIVYLTKKIIKHEVLPTISSSNNLDFSVIEAYDKKILKELIKYNSNLILIVPNDFEASSNVVSEDRMSSQLVAGTRQVPNPKFNRLQMQMRRAERELIRAQSEAERGFQMSQCISCGLITQWGGVALQSKWQKVAKDLQYQISSLTNDYASTPEYETKETLRSYEYLVQNVKASKIANFKVLEFKDKKFFEKKLNIEEIKDFRIAYNVDPQDKNYDSLLNKYSTTEDLTRFQNEKLQNLSSQNLFEKISAVQDFKELSREKDLYASLDFSVDDQKKSKSLFGDLFNFGGKKNKNKNIKNSSNYELKDKRFASVVIVKTEDGLGTGFYISKDEILTNYHVVENAMSIFVIDKNKKKSSAVIIKKDLKRDLALIKTNMNGPPVSFFSGQLKQGEMVEALGHPKGRKFSLTKGWISAIRQESSIYNATQDPNVLYIQTDAAINSGNSGGPLFYKDQVVGVNTQKLAGKSIEGMNFAVHFSEVQKFLSQ